MARRPPPARCALAAYLAGLYEAGRSPAVAGMVAAAVRFQMKLAGKPSPVGPATERVLRGFRRKGADRGRGQVAGVRWEQADAAAAAAANDGRSVKGLRDAAIVAVMSDAMLRVSEAAALHVADLEAEGGNTLTVRRSKTDQEGEGVAQYIGGPTVVRVRAWMDAAGIADGPLFQRLDKAGKPRGRPPPCRAAMRGASWPLVGPSPSCAMVPDGPPRDGCPFRAVG